MTIDATCSCGKTLRVPDQYAGKRVKCPGCGQALAVPAGGSAAPASAGSQQAACKCGAKFKVTPQLSGKKVRCPKCKEVMQLPAFSAGNATAGSGTGGAAAATGHPATPAAPTPTPAAAANPFAEQNDGFWEELGGGATAADDSLFPSEEEPKHQGELAATDLYGYAIKLFHQGYAPDQITVMLVDKGLKEDDAERLVMSLTDQGKAAPGGRLDIGYIMFAFGGPISRSEWWLGQVVLAVVQGILGFCAGFLIGMFIDNQDQIEIAIKITYGVILLLSLWSGLAINFKRCEDLDISPVWLFVPFANLVILFQMMFIKGYS